MLNHHQLNESICKMKLNSKNSNDSINLQEINPKVNLQQPKKEFLNLEKEVQNKALK